MLLLYFPIQGVVVAVVVLVPDLFRLSSLNQPTLCRYYIALIQMHTSRVIIL